MPKFSCWFWHSLLPAAQVPHLPAVQTWPAAHTTPPALAQAPQLYGSVCVLTQPRTAPQFAVPIGQAQALLTQVEFGPHDLPQAPQFFGSVVTSVQVLPQTCCPA